MSNDQPFMTMAQRITHNLDASFGGACVLVPPNGGTPIELLMLDAHGDEGQFWATIITRIQMAMQAAEQKNAQTRVFGR